MGEAFTTGLDASWELDVFGGLSRLEEAAQADLGMAQEERRDVLVTVLAEVALSYTDLRAVMSRLEYARRNLELQESTLGVVQAQQEAGATTLLDVSRAQAQVATMRAGLPVYQQQALEARHRIAVLLGQPPGALDELLASAAPVATPAITVAIGVPAEVLRRRPDVRKAERRLAAESARLGAKVADLYPKFSLSGSIGLESLSLGNLFETASRAFSIGPTVQWTAFDGGRLRAQVSIQEAVREETLLAYESGGPHLRCRFLPCPGRWRRCH